MLHTEHPICRDGVHKMEMGLGWEFVGWVSMSWLSCVGSGQISRALRRHGLVGIRLP